MRDILSDELVRCSEEDESVIVLSGDHGYALFDDLRKRTPEQFLNVGIMEQAMLGIAAGLAAVGRRPIVYGLASFVPMRVLEQIKLDICFSKLPVKIMGDGAGVVYSYLGNSHFCYEDIACLMSMPNIEIYTPGDAKEMKICLKDFFSNDKPAYLRIGKSDNPAVLGDLELQSTAPYFSVNKNDQFCIVSMGSMNGISSEIAMENSISHISICQMKPFNEEIVKMLHAFDTVIVIEEHNQNGGLQSILLNEFVKLKQVIPRFYHIAFKDQFVEKAGSYQYALSEHEMSFEQIKKRVGDILNE